MKKIVTVVLTTVFLLVLIVGTAFSFYIGKSVFNGITNVIPRSDTVEHQKFYIDAYKDFENTYNVHSVGIESTAFDHIIPAVYVDREENDNAAVIIHGMGGTKESTVHIMSFFLENGFDVLAFDQRNSGENLADYNTNGILESYDALDAVNHMRSQMPEGAKLVLYGESYGGATAGIALGRDESKIDYVILDCPVSNGMYFADQIFAEVEEQTGIPVAYMVLMGDLYSRMKLGFRFSSASSVANYLGDTHTPTLIFRSLQDVVTPPEMGEALYAAIPHDQKELVTSDTSAHVSILQEEPELFRESILGFLEKYNTSDSKG